MNRTPLFRLIVASALAMTLGTGVSFAQDENTSAATSASKPADSKPVDSKPTDTLNLPGTSIIGNKELPVGLDFVPWRPAVAGEIKQGPTQLLDEPLEPVDPDVFRRKLQIYSDTQH